MIEKDNPVLVALDVANTYAKGIVLYQDGNSLKIAQFSIPHGYMPLSDTQWKEAQQTANTGRGHSTQTHSFQYVVGGSASAPQLQAVKIGKSAVLSGTMTTVYGNAKYKAGYMDAYVAAALAECFPKRHNPKGYNNIYLAFGFPSSDWQMVDTMLTPLVNKTHRIIEPDGSKRAFAPRFSMAVDENGGGMMRTLHRIMESQARETQTGQFTKLKDGDRILMLDAGGWLGSMAWGEVNEFGFPMIDYTQGRIAAIDGGIVTVRSSLRETLKTKYSAELQGLTDSRMDDIWLDKVMREKGFTLSGRKDNWFDASEAIDESAGVYLNNVKAAYQRMGNGLQADHIILTGGTIDPLYNQVLTLLNHGSVLLADERQELYWANVRGILQILIDRLLAEDKMPSELMPFFKTGKADKR